MVPIFENLGQREATMNPCTECYKLLFFVHGMAKNKHPTYIKVIANDKLVVNLANEWLG